MSQWSCPYCRRDQIISSDNFDEIDSYLDVGKTDFETALKLKGHAIRCLNIDCNKLTLIVKLDSGRRGSSGWVFSETLNSWRLLPESSAKPQSDFVPEVIRNDYYEACRIRDLSPKASATLIRRCLQGMIRDFCGISLATLNAEIKALKTLVDDNKAPQGVSQESVDAIDHVRTIGNIGAHMEKDINIIIDVDPEEAQILIELAESLFEEWYVARDIRQKRFSKIKELSESKKATQKSLPPPDVTSE